MSWSYRPYNSNVVRANNDMLGQKCEVKVRSCKSFIQEKEKQKEERTQDKLNSIISKIVDYLSQQPAGNTHTAIRESLGLSGKVASEALNAAIERDWIKRESIKRTTVTSMGMS